MDSLMWFVFGFLVGWGVLPQPEWAKPLISKLTDLLSGFFNKPPAPPAPPSSNTTPTSNT